MLKVIMVTLGLLLGTEAYSMRCQGDLVLVGDTVQEVITKCGSPDSSYSDVWQDQVEIYYNIEGTNYTVVLFKNRVTEVLLNGN